MVMTKIQDEFTISKLIHKNTIFFLERVAKFEIG